MRVEQLRRLRAVHVMGCVVFGVAVGCFFEYLLGESEHYRESNWGTRCKSLPTAF